MTAQITTTSLGYRVLNAEADGQNTNMIIRPARNDDGLLMVSLWRNTNHARFDMNAEDEAVLLTYLQERAEAREGAIDAHVEQLANGLLGRLRAPAGGGL